jgi:hypothetical protein
MNFESEQIYISNLHKTGMVLKISKAQYMILIHKKTHKPMNTQIIKVRLKTTFYLFFLWKSHFCNDIFLNYIRNACAY